MKQTEPFLIKTIPRKMVTAAAAAAAATVMLQRMTHPPRKLVVTHFKIGDVIGNLAPTSLPSLAALEPD